MIGETNSSELLHCDPEQGEDDRENPSSPFVTFGKTPPKVFKSKRLQLFGGKPDIALVGIAGTEELLYNMVHCSMVLDITWFKL